MATTSIDKEFNVYWEKLGSIQKQSFLNLIKSFFIKEEGIDIIQYNRELDEAERRIETGKYISQEDLEKEAETW